MHTRLRFKRLGILLFFAACAAFAQLQPVGSNDRIATVKEFLISIYPDLSGVPVRLAIEDWRPLQLPGKLDFFSVLLLPASDVKVPNCTQGQSTILSSSFQYDATSGILGSFSAHGQLVDEDRNKQLLALVRQHEEWDKPAVGDAMRKLGAQFPPEETDALRKAMPIQPLEGVYGPLRFISLEFPIHPDGCFDGTPSGERKPCVDLNWVAIFESDSPSKAVIFARFEPFGGRLIGLFRNPE